MPTLVQQPDLVNPQVSQTQAIARPEKSGTLSTFMQTILPTAVQAAEAYNKETADFNMALGQNDQLNGIAREVSFLDARNYNAGKEFQKVASTQASMAAEFDKTSQAMVDESKSPEEILEYGREYTRKFTQMIKDSDLDNDTKKTLYDAGLKTHAAQYKGVQEKLQAAAAKASIMSAGVRTATLATQISDPNSGVDSIALGIDTFISVEYDVQSRVMGLDAPKAKAAADAAVAGTVKHLLSQIDPTAANAGVMVDKLDAAVEHMRKTGISDIGTTLALQTEITALKGRIMDSNAIAVQNKFLEFKSAALNNFHLYTPAVLQSELGTINHLEATGALTPQASLAARTQLFQLGEQLNQKQLNGELTGAAILNGVSLLDAQAQGVDEAKYNSLAITEIARRHPNNPIGASKELYARGIQGDSDSRKLGGFIKEGSKIQSQMVLSILSLPTATAQADPRYGAISEMWQDSSALYQRLRNEKSILAEEMLQGIPDDYREILGTSMATGGAFADAQIAVQNKEAYTQRGARIREGINKLSVEDFDSGLFKAGAGGDKWWDNLPNSMKHAQLETMISASMGSMPTLRKYGAGGTKESVIAAMNKANMIIPTKGANAIVYARHAEILHSVKDPAGLTISQDILSAAISEVGARVTNKLDMTQNRMAITGSENGSSFWFQPLDRDGNQLNVGGAIVQGIDIPTSEVIKVMQRIQAEVKAKGLNINKKHPLVGLDGGVKAPPLVGLDGGTAGRFTQRPQGAANPFVQSNEAFSYRPNAPIGQTVVRTPKGNVPVKLTTETTLKFGGNVPLTNKFHNWRNAAENFVTTPTRIKGKVRQKNGTTTTDSDSLVIGNGVNLLVHKQWAPRFAAVQGDAQGVLRVQAEFEKEFYKDLQLAARSVGIPVATNAPYNPQLEGSQFLLADYKWHTGSYEAIRKIMNADNITVATRMMKASAAYTGAGSDSVPRNKDRLAWLRQHYLVRNNPY